VCEHVFVRWNGQVVGAEGQASLPGADGDVVIRRFDAPEALETRFYEVRAKSALNRVPDGGRVPFAWTINPYRGCSHACTYCVRGETPILLADGRTRPMAELRIGDVIVGTQRDGERRRFIPTQVLDHWSSLRPAYRTVLANGTELVTSADHRLLTTEDWRRVFASDAGAAARRYLGVGDQLLGPSGSDAEGTVVGAAPGGQVASVENLERVDRLYDITTGTGDYVSGGVISHNCFARPTHEYLDLDAGRDFEREIVVKVNVPEVLRAELKRPTWKREHVALGTNTDPYQWVEGRYKLMRGIWEAMRDAANPCSVLTKSPLVLRDVDLLLEIAQRTTVSACLSVPTLDEKAWRATEPHTPHPRARLEAVAELNRRGIPTGILIAPLMPGINDDPEQVERILALAAEAGATSVGGQTLFLRGATRTVFMDWLRTSRPDLVPRYEELYARGSYAPKADRHRIESTLRRAHRVSPLTEERFFRRSARSTPTVPAVPVRSAQGSLF
jgi:DNA repair photolyase